jgi:glycosyltransferase involved in cell wall biosynthesis
VLTNIPSPYQVELFNAIARRDRLEFRVWYCAPRDTRRLWEDQPLHHWHHIGAGWRVKTRREHWYLDPRPARELVAWKPDLTVLSVYTVPTVQLAMRYARSAGLPWVYWGEAVGAGGNGILRRLARRLALGPVTRGAAGFFGVGRKGVENFRATFGTQRPVLNVPYFSDLARFMPTEVVPLERERTFLYVGSFIHRKGVDILARAFSELVATHPQSRLVVAGDGDPQETFDRHLSAAAAVRVRRLPFVPWARLPELYREGDFLVMPSRYDGWGLVIPEAMASGVPVIGSVGAGATLDLVRDRITGWRVEPDDVEGLAVAMRGALAQAPGALSAMRQRCVERARRYDAAVGARVFERAVRIALRSLP